MNSYKVTYILNGEEHYDHITERTEKAAQKRVKGIYKDAEITDTELVSDDVNATKEQERETLEKIKAMIAELGPQSYLKTAFDGVYEVAEMNIEEDAAYSFPGRVNILEEQLPEELRRDLWVMVTSEAEASRARMAEAADKMAVSAPVIKCKKTPRKKCSFVAEMKGK
ncbi:MAG: hypothetical protein K2P37_11790, partial [Oscillospiraceae bacterium]|nr:hypothetical protein [Oscillospiraceae bacterium]